MKSVTADPLEVAMNQPRLASTAVECVPPSPVLKGKPMPPYNEEITQPTQEMDVWWGSYSGWTMLPSWFICFALTGLIYWGFWSWLPKGWVQLAVVSFAGAVWLVQVIRWSYRLFGYNYRLTNQRLFYAKGFLYNVRFEVALATVVEVQVQRSTIERLVHVGRVCLFGEDRTQPPLVLEGVRHPMRLAEEVRELARQARERNIAHHRIAESQVSV